MAASFAGLERCPIRRASLHRRPHGVYVRPVEENGRSLNTPPRRPKYGLLTDEGFRDNLRGTPPPPASPHRRGDQ